MACRHYTRRGGGPNNVNGGPVWSVAGRLFGAVTVADLVAAIATAGGPDVDKRRVEVAAPIKTIGAHQITVRLTRSDGVVSLEVSDDGVGFDRAQLGVSRGLGLITIRERAGQLNGTFECDTAPGRGTTIRVVIPFR